MRQQATEVTPQSIAARFHAAGFSNRDIGLMVGAHAGHLVWGSTIANVRSGAYSGRNLEPAFLALAAAWRLV
jgi:hypothetical protein